MCVGGGEWGERGGMCTCVCGCGDGGGDVGVGVGVWVGVHVCVCGGMWVWRRSRLSVRATSTSCTLYCTTAHTEVLEPVPQVPWLRAKPDAGM